jgi:CheY-like chemotaxis protein
MVNQLWLAEDDPDDVEFFLEALNEIDQSISCVYARNGAELIQKIKTKQFPHPEVIFLDVNMPEMNGWETLDHIKRDPELAGVPVIMYSTSSARRDAQKAIAEGALCFYEKPANYVLLKEFLFHIISSNPVDKTAILSLAKNNRTQKIFV